jgi:hypothetical protein
MLTLSIADRGEYDDRTFQNPIKFNFLISFKLKTLKKMGRKKIEIT